LEHPQQRPSQAHAPRELQFDAPLPLQRLVRRKHWRTRNAFETQAKQSKAESAQFKKQLEELIPELKDYRDKDNAWMVDTRWVMVMIVGTVLAAIR